MTELHVPESRYSGEAPKITWERPPTRREVWAYVEHYYRGVKTREAAISLAVRLFCSNYVRWVQVNGWFRQPDWTEGDPIIREACPRGREFTHEAGGKSAWYERISELLEAWGRKPLPDRNTLLEED